MNSKIRIAAGFMDAGNIKTARAKLWEMNQLNQLMYRKLLYTFLLSMGIISIISFIFVYQANVKLYNELMTLKHAGQTVVPNKYILPTLKQFLPAFCSSLFISFTAGSFISLIICFFVLIFLSYRKKTNKNYSLYTSAILFTLSAVLLTGIFLTDSSIFHRIRDYVLLSFPAGVALNNFYYTYSPYAANAIAFSIYIKTLCSAGLFAGLPVILFLFLFSLSVLFSKKFIPDTWAVCISCTVIYIIIAGGLLFLYPSGKADISSKVSKEMLISENGRIRIEALRMLYLNKQVFQPNYQINLNNASIAEQYWIAKNLSKCDSPQSIQILKKLLKEKSLIVQTAAIKSFGTGSCSPDIMEMLNELIIDSPHWYVQIAADNAVRKCFFSN
jgi:hypothetical protein